MPRLTGKNGSVRLPGGGLVLPDTFSWEYEERQKVDPCSIKGESFEVYAADNTVGLVRIQSFVQGGSPLSSQMDANRVTNVGVGTLLSFDLRGVEGSLSDVRVQGTGWLTRSQVRVARDGLITDELEIQVDGGATITVN